MGRKLKEIHYFTYSLSCPIKDIQKEFSCKRDYDIYVKRHHKICSCSELQCLPSYSEGGKGMKTDTYCLKEY